MHYIALISKLNYLIACISSHLFQLCMLFNKISLKITKRITHKVILLIKTDVDEPHRARTNKLRQRMDMNDKVKSKLKYIPLNQQRKTLKPMFIQTDSIRILPPNLGDVYDLTNISKTIGGTNAILPKFKPISDEQILRISEILKDMPIKTSTNRYEIQYTTEPYYSTNTERVGRFRKGKGIKDNFVEDSTVEEVTSKIISTTKGIERNDEKKCPQGGTCEFFFYCWMVGGLLEGSCGSVLKGCCHRVAKAGILGVQDSNNIDYDTSLSYGPVINDQSKS